jgi:hypothetical protein
MPAAPPPPNLLKRDTATRRLNILDYLQMLLHQRYEDLADGNEGQNGFAPGKVGRPQKGRPR